MDKQVHVIKSDTDYAMRMLVYLAMNGQAGPVSAAVLVKTQQISVDFAYKILQKLGRARIVKSLRGSKGGFRLAKEPQQITLLDVMESVQGPLVIRPCLLNDAACPMYSSCPVSAQLRKLQGSLRESMQNITLARLTRAKQGKVKRGAGDSSREESGRPAIKISAS